METIKCPECGNILAGERPKFCGQCGCNVSDLIRQEQNQETKSFKLKPSDDPITTNEKQTVYLEKLKEAWSDGKVPVSELEELGNLREELGITNSEKSKT